MATLTNIIASYHTLLCFAQLMQDTPRLVKLKRSHTRKTTATSDVSHDAHLRDYDEEIFDVGDFYHQVCDYVIYTLWQL